MNIFKLPSNSEAVLLELVSSDNPTQTLISRYKEAQGKRKDELDGIIRELRENSFVQVKWADNLPYFVTLNNSARNYFKQSTEQGLSEKEASSIIFISHRSTDKYIADIILEFLIGTGIPREKVFCSSLPGNDINEKISDEVKTALKNSVVNIAILSLDYYQSAFCLNEAGVLWYSDVTVIPIALPEIEPDNMYGFLNSNYKLRRLNSDTDVSYLYDTIRESLKTAQAKASLVTTENNKLRAKYTEYIKRRETEKTTKGSDRFTISAEITTDDERIVLYYALKKAVRTITKSALCSWLNEEEIYDVNVENAFDLLSSFDGKNTGDTLELGIQLFRQYSSQSSIIISQLEECVKNHTQYAVDSFRTLWPTFDSIMRLFTSYIIDEKMNSFGDRWMAEGQIKSIENWEGKNNLNSLLSSNYGSCLELFIQNKLVYASSWTSHGNPREYKLCPTLIKYLFEPPLELSSSIQQTKIENHNELPF